MPYKTTVVLDILSMSNFIYCVSILTTCISTEDKFDNHKQLKELPIQSDSGVIEIVGDIIVKIYGKTMKKHQMKINKTTVQYVTIFLSEFYKC